MSLKYILCVLLFIWYQHLVIAQVREGKKSGLQQSFFIGSIIGGEPGDDSLHLVFRDDLLMPGNQSETSFYVKPDDKGQFSFHLPTVNDIGRVSISISGSHGGTPGSWTSLNHYLFPFYYVENKDSVSLIISINKRGTVRHWFSGNGVNKYLAGKSLSNTVDLFAEESSSGIGSEEMIEEEISQNCLTVKIRQEMLDHYREALNPKVYQVMKADIIGVTKRSLIFDLESFMRNRKIFEGEIDWSYFNKDSLNDDILALSDDYIEYIIKEVIFKFQTQGGHVEYSVSDIYSVLKNNFQGLLRDKLLCAYLLESNRRNGEVTGSFSDYEFCVDDAFNVIEHNELRDLIKSKIAKYRSGSPAYNFALPDYNGRIVKLSDFRGKVVLVDIYSTRCSGCRTFAKTLKERVFPEFKDNSDVIFVAISTEKDKTVWLQDLEQGHNASKVHEICLYTDGKGVSHPYIEYYQINSVPTLFLIDKMGKIYNSSQNTLKAYSSGEEVVKMIHEILEN